jgi:hypothetical protein
MSWQGEDPEIQDDVYLSEAIYVNKKKVRGWELDESLSNVDRGVYYKDGKAKVVFRGTNFTSGTIGRDLGTDALVALGLDWYSSRIRNSEKTVDLVIQKYGRKNVSLTGHSLGGFIASQISRTHEIPATGFDTTMSPFEFAKGRKYKQFHSMSSYYDPFSTFTRYFGKVKKHTVIAPQRWNPHTVFNYM